jgi:exonuclease VII small subunit
LIYNNEGTQRVFRPKNKSINMALIKIKQIEGLRVINDSLAASVNSLEQITVTNATNIGTNAGDIDSLEASVTSLEAIVSNKLDAADLSNLEASVNSLETITGTNATNIGTNAGDIDSLEASVNSLETITGTNATNIGTNAGDIDSLEASVNSLETITGNLGSAIDALVSREVYGAEDVDGLTASAGAQFTVPFTAGKFAPWPYDYEVYVNGVKTLQQWVTAEFDGTNVGLTLPYDIDENDVFTIKGVDLIP